MASWSTRVRRPTTIKQQPEPQSRAKWTSSLTKVLADLMVDQVTTGNKQNNSFGKKAWECICKEFQKSTGFNWDKEQLKNRYTVLKKQFFLTKSLLDEPDFIWDEFTGAIVATNEAWDNYIVEHPDAEILRSTGCSLYKQLCTIFLENGTTDNYLEEGPESLYSTPHPSRTLQGKASTSESEEITEMAVERDKLQPNTASRNGTRKRGRKGIDDVLASAISEMAAASKLRAHAVKQHNERYSISNCIKALDELKGIDEQIYYAALDLFDNRNARETFLSLKVDKRLTWLLGKCSIQFGCL